MATEPSLDPTGALAIRPPRENIFVRPRADADRAEGPRPTGIFASAAACAPADAANVSIASGGTVRHRLIGWPTRVVAVVGMVAAITALTMRPAPDSATSPSQRTGEPSTTSRRSSRHGAARPKPMRDRAAAKRVRRARRSAAPKRAPDPRSAPRLAAPPPPAAPASSQRVTPSLPPRQTGPLPKRVPAGAPPEFM
jgi:hypothetical protein